jgi:hypothetical protein
VHSGSSRMEAPCRLSTNPTQKPEWGLAGGPGPDYARLGRLAIGVRFVKWKLNISSRTDPAVAGHRFEVQTEVVRGPAL